MSYLITSKKVTRWYFHGKGYSSKKLAYKKLAYRLLLDELLGPVEVKTEWGENIYGEGGSYEVKLPRTVLRDLSDDEAKDVIHDAFVLKFPHEVSPECKRICLVKYLGDGETEDGFVYDTCKAAQQDWINQKAEELIADTADATGSHKSSQSSGERKASKQASPSPSEKRNNRG